MDLCDELGLLTIAEAFDEWNMPKVTNGYGTVFQEWGEQDLVSLIHRDRNHPSLIMWSLGNEILDQNHEEGVETAKFLCEISHREDPTRPTTFGINNPEKAISIGFCDVVDVVGFNYQANNYEKYRKEHPEWIILGSETASTVSSRGVYQFPAVCDFPVAPHSSGYVSSYDLSGPPWSYTPEKEFTAQEQFPEILGEFVWTGFDYLGEPTPFRNQWPSHVSYFGIVDMAGLPKDRYYNYQARWTTKPMVHLFPHWNWENGMKIPVHAHSNCHKIELFLNGTSLGFATQDTSIVLHEESGKCDEVPKFRFIWENIPFVAGKLEAFAYDENGVIVAKDQVETAGKPDKIAVIPDKTILEQGELTFITVNILDNKGILCPDASELVKFTVEGSAVYVAADSGDQCSTRIFSEPYCNVFHGRCVFCVKATEIGTISLKCHNETLGETEIFLSVQ